MYSGEFLKLSSKFGLVMLLVGIGISIAGFLGFFIETDAHNRATMISGLALGAVGYVMVMLKHITAEEL